MPLDPYGLVSIPPRQLRGQSWGIAVRVATTGNITIATALNAGDTIDGVTLAAGDDVLVKDQSTGSQNGIYVAGATPKRRYDMDQDQTTGRENEEIAGHVVRVVEGTVNGGTWWQTTNPFGDTLGSDDVVWEDCTPGGAASAVSSGNDVVWPLSEAMPAWVKPTGSGVITADPQGRITVDTGADYKAFPGLTFLEGSLYVVYRYGTAHNSGASSIKLRRSYDLGRTWTSAVNILSVSGTDDLRDPNITALASGRLLLSYDTRNPYSSSTAIVAYTGYSDDRGQTWTTGVAVTATGSTTIASAQAIELPNGSILLPGFVASGGLYTAVVWKSTDGGLTFGSQVTIATGTHDWEEPVIRLLASGKIVALMRDSAGTVTYRSVSTTLGATWGAAASVVTAGGRPDFVEFYPGCLLLFCRSDNTTNFDPRWAVSWDEGATWTALQETDTGVTTDLEYSAPVVLAPGYVAVVYSVENSGSDADLYLRYYFDGFGMDPLGQARLKWLQSPEQTAPSTPPSGTSVIYPKSDGLWYSKDDAGTETLMSGSAPSFATPAIVLGTAAAAGAASTVIRSDSTIVAFDATAPTTLAFGDSAATGAAAVAARRDHGHGMPASPTGGHILIASEHSSPLVFEDMVQNSEGTDFMYASE